MNISILLTQNNIILRIRDGATYDEIKKELKEKMPELKKFYQEEKTPILVTGKILKVGEIEKIKSIIQKSLDVKIEFDSPKELGLHGIKKNYKKEISISETKYFKKPIRSGEKIEFEGSIVVLGDVNSGAEIIAEDNIVVLGKLRGMAHAGAKGNEKAIISATLIDSSQIRIASKILERNREAIQTQAYNYAYINKEGVIELTN